MPDPNVEEVDPNLPAAAAEANSAAAGEGDGTGSAAPAGGQSDGTPAPSSTEPPAWAVSRIDALTRQKKEAQETIQQRDSRIADLEAKLAALQGGEDPPTGRAATGLTAADIDRLAEQKLQERIFAEKCGKVYDEGKAAHEDFDSALRSFVHIGGMPRSAMDALLELDNPHEVLYDLSKDLDKAQGIFQMTPVRQATALAKMALKPGAKAAVSGAPNPVKGKVNSGTVDTVVRLDDKSADMVAWAKQREKERAARKAAN